MILDLLKKCIQEFNLDVNYLRDMAFAICIADKLDGTNKKELDIDKFVESDSELDWSEVLKTLGISPQNRGCGSLPRVQKLRVISDILTISLCTQIEDLTLSCKVSKQVSNKLGVSISSVDYADEDACYANLKKIEDYLNSNSIDLDDLRIVYDKLCIFSDRIITVGNFNIPDRISDILIPDVIFKNLGKKCSIKDLMGYLEKNDFTLETYSLYIIDVYCYEMVQKVAKLLNERFKRNEVEFNLILTRLGNFAYNYLPIGTYSLNGYTHRLSVLRNVPSYLSRKVNVVFSENSAFSDMTILGCICVLYLLKKINMNRDELNKEMEGLLNECRE